MMTFLVVCGLAQDSDNPCAGKPDGAVPEWGCRWFLTCHGEAGVTTDCSDGGLVYNPDIQACDT